MLVQRPPQQAVELLERAMRRSKRRSSVRLPLGFARDTTNKTPAPPLAELLRGGGEVRLKVFLTVLMMATAPPHSTKVTAKDLAEMLDLSDPEQAGSRRINKAFADLVKAGLVRRDRDPGYVPVSTVLDPAGSLQEWSADALPRPYISLPLQLWSRGWLIALSGRSLALLIILRELTNGRAQNTGWADGIRKRQYGLSDDTWTKAQSELVEAGLLEMRTHVYPSRGEPRRRNIYTLHLDHLSTHDPGESTSP
jgi:hypothetical protein